MHIEISLSYHCLWLELQCLAAVFIKYNYTLMRHNPGTPDIRIYAIKCIVHACTLCGDGTFYFGTAWTLCNISALQCIARSFKCCKGGHDKANSSKKSLSVSCIETKAFCISLGQSVVLQLCLVIVDTHLLLAMDARVYCCSGCWTGLLDHCLPL